MFNINGTVLSFPILTDIYAEPIISQLMNVYPVSAPTISIPRTRIKATVRPYDGSASTEYTIPTATSLIRPGFMQATCAAGRSNVFTAAGVAADGSLKMNRRYTIMDQITVTDSNGPTPISMAVNMKPDSRDQFFGEATFAGVSADAGTTNKITVTGHINYDTGDVTVQGTLDIDGTATYTYTFTSVRLKARFVPVNTMNGRTTVTNFCGIIQ
ncbi:MAG: hypothetical protein GY870_16560 [archaeon]|nr:hypothetical protein [archaeon]